MANRTNHPKKLQTVAVEPEFVGHDEPVIEAPVIEEPIIVEEKPAEEVTIENTILLEKINELRFVDSKGKWFRLEIHASGVYWLYPA